MGNTTIAVLEEVTQVVEIVLPGPQGPVGDIHPSMPGLVQQATDAATSATASALSADTSEANASASAAAALASKNAAAVSEDNALASANAASESATVASTKAGEASASATSAAASATAAATSATDTANALVGERSAVATLTNKTITSPVIDSGTANGVTYLDGNKVLTAGSGLTYNGSALQINAESYPSLKLGNAAGVSKGELYFGVGGDDLNLVSYVAGPIVFKPGNAEQMRLTSTGLGIGTSSPSARIVTAQSGGGNTAYASVDSWSDDFQTSRSGIGFNARIDHTAYSQAAVQLDAAKSGWLIQGRNAPGAEAVYDWFSVSRVSPTGVSTKMLDLDASGNLGLGVTPSAWFGTWKAIQVGASGALSSRSDVFGTLLSQNAFIGPTGDVSYIGNDAASSYTLIGAEHRWSIAPSGTAGQPISFTQAMTLDASGKLGVGTTSPSKPLTVIGGSPYQLRIASSEGAYSDAGIFLGSDAVDPYYYGSMKWRQSDQTFRLSSQHGSQVGGMVFEVGWGLNAPTEAVRITPNRNLTVGDGGHDAARLVVKRDAASTGVADSASIVLSNRSQDINGGIVGGIFADTFRDVADPHYTAGIWFTRNQNAGNLSSSSEIVFGTAGGNSPGAMPTERMRMNDAGQLMIGTTSSLGALTVRGAIVASGASSSDTSVGVVNDGTTYVGFGLNTAGSINSFGVESGLAYLGTTGSYPIAFTIGGSEMMRLYGGLLNASGVEVRAARHTNLGPVGSGENNARNHFLGYNAGSASVATGWIAAAFGDATAPRPVIGSFSGKAVIGAHNGGLTAWAPITLGATEYAFTSDGVSERMRLDSSGNLGLGVVPSAWGGAGVSAMQIGAAGSFTGSGGSTEVRYNAYYDGTVDRYTTSQPAFKYGQQYNLGHVWSIAPSGTAGSPISFTQAMTLGASGGLMVGTSTDYGERLHVSSAGAGDVISMRIAASQENGSNGMARRIQWSLRDSTGSLINTNSIRSEWSDVGTNSAKLVFTSASNNWQSDAMTLDASGNLLVGTTSLQAKLAVKGASANTYLLYDNVGSGECYYGANSFHAFSTAGAERARIDTNGNLLVGKTAQSSGGKLEVAGNVVCQPSTAAPTLAVNGEMSFQLVSDTSLKILVRGSDGITRSTTLTLT